MHLHSFRLTLELEENRIYASVVKITYSTVWNQQHVGRLSLERPMSTSAPEPLKNVSDYRTIWFWPVDKRVPFIVIPAQSVPSEILKQHESFDTTLYKATMSKWSVHQMQPLGEFAGVLGQIGELHTESKALLVSAGVTWEEFADEVIDSLVETVFSINQPWEIPESEIQTREDLRTTRVFSIDPPTARDLDDALSCKELPDGYEIGVHIADVSYFVSPGTAVDDEAFNRATSVYLVQKVIPMLPRLLCEELCSLNAGVDRLSFSVFWKFDFDGNIIGEPRFSRSIIRSCAKLWYDHAQAVIEDRDWNQVSPVELFGDWTEEQVQDDIRILYKFSQVLRQRRYDNGALTLNSIKLWFKLDDLGNPMDTGMYLLKDANRLIEEVLIS